MVSPIRIYKYTVKFQEDRNKPLVIKMGGKLKKTESSLIEFCSVEKLSDNQIINKFCGSSKIEKIERNNYFLNEYKG